MAEKGLIVGTGSSLPSREVTNEEISRIVDTDDEWIKTRTGISTRRIVRGNENNTSLAINAAKMAIDDAGIDPVEIGLTIVATTSSDYSIPSTACLIQKELGYAGGPAFDLSAACSGFVFALAASESMMNSGPYRSALVVGVDCLSRVMDWNDRSTCILFGDGAGAVVIERVEVPDEFGFLSHYLRSDGAGGETLYSSQKYPDTFPFGPPPKASFFPDESGFLKMNGRETFKFAVRVIVEATEKVLKDAGLDLEDIDHFIPHQANARIVDFAAETLGIPQEKMVCDIGELGNTSAASIPIALDEINREGRIKDGDLVLMAGFGGGLTWGANLYRWKTVR